ncbi:MAG: aminotransferase class IV [Luteolibacter sp.]|jgi:branched-subunit amino acid aminotransferase/4-amino-4-deoxychorismate lyase|nr:aminotransferase class IV [Luteolibacter sp.]
MIRIWCNGQWMEPLDFSIAVTDRGLMHGLGLFETILAVDGKPVFPERHLTRLDLSCRKLGWHFDFARFRQFMVELLAANGPAAQGRARIRLAITGGSGPVNDLSLGEDHIVMLSAAPVAEPPATTTANCSPFVRNERSALSGMKCGSYAENLVAQDHARRLGFEETVFSNSAGMLCEAATSNLFLVKGGCLHTPSLHSGCLAGITREVVIGLAAELGIPSTERDVAAAEIHEADEILLTSSIRGVMGVSRFEDRIFELGPVTALLRAAWNRAVLQEISR